MPATSEMIARVRGMVGDFSLTSAVVSRAIERYPLMDSLGVEPLVYDEGTPPTARENPSWMATYDLYAASADLLEEKAAVLVKDFDFATEQERFERSQKYSQTMGLIRHYRSRRALNTALAHAWPKPGGQP